MNFKFNFKSTVDTKKLTAFLDKGDDILIGYPEGRPHPDSDLTMDELARIQTYGNAQIPARPFLEEGILSKKNEIRDTIRDHYMKRVENGADKRPGLKRIAAEGVGAVQEFVRGDYYRQTVPNAESTIRRKSRRQKGKVLQSDKPLIDTADMINATTSVIKEGR